MFLWEEAWNTIVYTQNKSPHKVLGSKTHEEAFTGRKPEIGHFRIFGCLTFSHVPLEKRTQLDPTVEKGILVGYSETSKAYRIYIPAPRKTIVRQDVKFEEDRAFKRSHDSHLAKTEEQEALKVEERSTSQVTSPRSSDQKEEQEAHSTQVVTATSRKKKPRWLQQTLKDAQEHVEAPRKTFRQRRPPQKYSNYMAFMCDIIDSGPSIFEEALERQVW
jgi:hypothetical protein